MTDTPAESPDAPSPREDPPTSDDGEASAHEGGQGATMGLSDEANTFEPEEDPGPS